MVAVKEDGCMVIIEMDATAKVGKQFIKMEVKALEEVDKLFLRKILTVPRSTPGESFFLEL